MKRAFLVFLIAVSALASEPSDPFDDPVTGFAGALVPLLTSFEQASIEKLL